MAEKKHFYDQRFQQTAHGSDAQVHAKKGAGHKQENPNPHKWDQVFGACFLFVGLLTICVGLFSKNVLAFTLFGVGALGLGFFFLLPRR